MAKAKKSKLNRPLIRKWIEALRSGQFAQGQERLVTNSNPARHCCLGVLCEVSRTKADWRSNGLLPPKLARAWGLGSTDPKVEVGGKGTTLSALNDSGEWSFARIATVIERQILGVKKPAAKRA